MAVTASDLRTRISIYRTVKKTNELNETTYDAQLDRVVWANIVPTSGRTAPLTGNVEQAEITHKVTVRSTSCPTIDRGMYFMFRGQRYDILYGYPIYNRAGWLELFCRLVVETSVESH